jgi:hypothetical protein
MKKKISEKKAPYGITDAALALTVQKIYDDINEIISSVNQAEGDDRDVSKGKEGDIRVVKRDKNDFRIEVFMDEGWYTTKPGALVPLDNPNNPSVLSNPSIFVTNFKNSWENYKKSVNLVNFYKDGDRVYLQGGVKTGTPGDQSVIFTLPQDYRPEETVVFPCIVSGTELGRIHVRKNGDVVMFSDDSTSKATVFTSLDGISFKIRE